MDFDNDEAFKEYVNVFKKIPVPFYDDLHTEDTDVYTGTDFIFGAAYLLLVKKFDPEEIHLNDMKKFLESFKYRVDEYIKSCPDTEKCKRYPEFVHMLTVIYDNLLKRGIKPTPFDML